ncbi:MAG: hypothetical protein C4308_08050 [Chitinophagaceae bacterium]
MITAAAMLSAKPKNFSGVWVNNSQVIRLQKAEGYYTARMDAPQQQLYNKTLKVQMKGDSIYLTLQFCGSFI